MAIRKSKSEKAKERRVAARARAGQPPDPALAELERSLIGRVVHPADPEYERDRQGSNPAFQAHPKLIAYCAVPNDVRLCLAYARARAWAVAVRAGGHSTAGFSLSDGLVIDVSPMSYAAVDAVRRRARVGAGTKFAMLNSLLDEYRLHLPGGACGDVCVAGYMQGGGYGYTSRQFGMNLDTVLELRVMLRDGRIVRASRAESPQLFWAMRGGTGGNFGVLLEIVYQLHPLPEVWAYTLIWDIEHAPRVLTELQANYMRTGASSRLGHMPLLVHHDGVPQMVMQGMYIGTANEGKAALASLFAIGEPRLAADATGRYGAMDAYLDDHPFEMPDLPPSATEDNATEDKVSLYIARPLEIADWDRIVQYYLTTPNQLSMACLEPYGGAINRVSIGDSAFIHRDVDMNFFVDVFWLHESERLAIVAWLDGFAELVARYANGHVYQNYPRRSLKNFRWAYWGKAFNTLLSIKNQVDPPPYFFRYPQSISPIPDDAGPDIARDSSPTMFNDEKIVYEE